ncbi:MAG: M24 family metallopeptidase, partial [Candidatus Heimdallarchaeaceae archaeon]
MKEKIKRIQNVLREHKTDGWIVFCHHSYDIHLKYLLEKWFASPTLVFIPQSGKPQVITSQMEAMVIDTQVYDVTAYKSGVELTEYLKKRIKNIPKESTIALNYLDDPQGEWSFDILPFGTFKLLTNLNKKIKYIPAKDIIFDIRAVKTKKEQENHKIAAKLAEELMEEIEPTIKPGQTEKELAAKIEYECNKRGGVAFDAIVASGKNSAIPHHKASSKKIKENEVLLIDYGVSYNFSNSDITHSYWIGKKPPDEVVKVYEAVDLAKEAAYTKIRAGVVNTEVENAVRAKFTELGFDPEKYFLHSTGHPVGIETHDIGVGIYRGTEERPGKPLIENSVITVEPGLYFQGKFGIRLEDDCIVTKEGSIRLS